MTRFLFSLIPQNLLSTIVGYVAHLRRPKLLAKCLRNGFQRRYNISLESAEHSLDYYPSMGALFMRRLRKGVRPIDEDSAYVHPCDSAIGAYGSFKKDLLLQVKGKTYFAESLLGGQGFLGQRLGELFYGGSVCNLLSLPSRLSSRTFSCYRLYSRCLPYPGALVAGESLGTGACFALIFCE